MLHPHGYLVLNKCCMPINIEMQWLAFFNTSKELQEKVFCMKTTNTLELWDVLTQTKAPQLTKGWFGIFVRDNLLSMRRNKQNIIAKSIVEAEYWATTIVVQELIWSNSCFRNYRATTIVVQELLWSKGN